MFSQRTPPRTQDRAAHPPPLPLSSAAGEPSSVTGRRQTCDIEGTLGMVGSRDRGFGTTEVASGDWMSLELGKEGWGPLGFGYRPGWDLVGRGFGAGLGKAVATVWAVGCGGREWAALCRWVP